MNINYPIGEIIREEDLYNNNLIFAEIICDDEEQDEVLSIAKKNIYEKIEDIFKITFVFLFLFFFLGMILYGSFLLVSSI